MIKWGGRRPQRDESATGITFVDVLFALVVGEMLTPLRDLSRITSAGASHLVVAGVLTLTSWIGYHSSKNRPGFLIRFPNLPLAQFVLDILMVIAYWVTAISYERGKPGGPVDTPTPVPETVLVAVSFGLYVLWDLVARFMRQNPAYDHPADEDMIKRHQVTLRCALVTFIMTVVVALSNPDSAVWAITVDVALVLLMLWYRFWKELVVTSPTPVTLTDR